MITIDNFAFCFFSNNIDIIIEQEKELTKLSPKYQIERWYRHERGDGRYMSFSQMVNDAIDDTDSEFMIFCNPKTNFVADDIETIIHKLSNGYCFASVVNFGFFGFSKELIRRIGMMDETFINGEWEDIDMAVRLNLFGKAVFNKYDYNKYDTTLSTVINLKTITKPIFFNKYNIKDDVIYVDKLLFKHKKISRRHSKLKQYIYDSWLDKNHNYSDCFMLDYLNKKIEIVNPISHEKNVKFNVKINRKDGDIKFELHANENIRIFFSVIKDTKDGRTLLNSNYVNNQSWFGFPIEYENTVEIRLFINDTQFFVTMMEPNENLDLNFNLPIILKWDYQ
jgi:hypothetical protein